MSSPSITTFPLPTNGVPPSLLRALERLSDAIGWTSTRELIRLFIDDGRAALARIDRAQRRFDGQGLQRVLSDLQGNSAMMGAHRLSRFCEEVTGDLSTDVAPRIAALQQEWSRIDWLLSMWVMSRSSVAPVVSSLAA